LEEAAARIRELDERPVPRGRAGRVRSRRVQRNGVLPAAHVPSPDEAPVQHVPACERVVALSGRNRVTRWHGAAAAEHLAGRIGGKPALGRHPHRRTSPHSGCRSLPEL